MAGIRVITSTEEKDINLLSDVDAEFVSLVRHGANRMPFRIIKEEKKGGGRMEIQALQSILAPKGVDFEALASNKGLEYLSEAKFDKIEEYGDTQKAVQVPLDLFNIDTLNLLKLGDTGAMAIVGTLKEDADKSQIITIGKEDAEKIAEIPIAPMDAIIGDQEAAASQALVASFKNMFEAELYSMLDIVHGVLKQSAAPIKKRKASIMSAVDAFKEFVLIGLDAVGESSVKFDNLKKGGSTMFETKEKFVEATTEVVKDVLKERDDNATEMQTQADKEQKEKELADAKHKIEVAEKGEDAVKQEEMLTRIVEKSIEKINERLDGIDEKLKEADEQLETDPSNVDKEDPPDQVEKEEPSIFTGILDRRPTRQAA